MRVTSLLSLVAALGLSGAALAQAQSPSEQASGPSAASSPHQRSATSAHANEATPNENPGPTGASSPHQRKSTRLAETDTGGMVTSGMMVEDRSGQSLGTVADVIPPKSGHHGYVIVSGKDGSSTPVPSRIAKSMAKNGKLVLDRSAFEDAPKMQKSEVSGGSGAAWQKKADHYWRKHRG